MEKNKKNLTNAQRFIQSYNNIDYTIRTRYNLNRSMGFSELIRKSVALNYIVRKYEDELIDYGRLRNAIIHGNEDYIMAEPHIEVVEEIEKIERLLTAPPKALETVCHRDVLTIESSKSMKEAIMLMASSSYSNIPVYNKAGEIIGIANGQKILDSFGRYLISGGNCSTFLNNVKIEDMLSTLEDTDYYVFANKDLTVEEGLEFFHSNSKLLAIIVTKNGGTKEKPLGIITAPDVLKMNTILENY